LNEITHRWLARGSIFKNLVLILLIVLSIIVRCLEGRNFFARRFFDNRQKRLLASLVKILKIIRAQQLRRGNGVRLKDQVVTVLDGAEGEQSLLDDVYETCKASGEEVLIYGVHGESPMDHKEFRKKVVRHVERFYGAGLRQRVLKKTGDKNFIAPIEAYKWVSVEETVPVPLYVYGDKIAFSQLTEPKKTIIIENGLIAQSVRQLFNFAWDQAKPVAPEKKIKRS